VTETRAKCLKRWREGLTRLDEDLAALESGARGDSTTHAELTGRLRELKAKKEELETKIEGAEDSDDAVWGEVQGVIDTFWESLGAEIEDLKGGTN